MKQWLKVWKHCIIKLIIKPSERHRKCHAIWQGRLYHFCECGYNMDKIPPNLRALIKFFAGKKKK